MNMNVLDPTSWVINMGNSGAGRKEDNGNNFLKGQIPDAMDEPDVQDYPDLEFTYGDTDAYVNEMAELYSYTEQPEFLCNVRAFEDYMESLNYRPCWGKLTTNEKRNVLGVLLDHMDIREKSTRLKCCRCFLYLMQGCWAECQSDLEQFTLVKDNVLLLYNEGVFSAFLELFLAECEAANVQRKIEVNIADSVEIRAILNVLYTFLEVIRTVEDGEYDGVRASLKEELTHPVGEELLVVKLFGLVTRFCSGSCPHYPIKKILLMIWKLILFTLGNSNALKEAKKEKREIEGLKAFDEDTIDVVKTMRSSTPPLIAGADGIETECQRRVKRVLRRSLIKQSSLDETLAGTEYETTREPSKSSMEAPSPPRKPGLPWIPKIRQRDLDNFLDAVRLKFLGYTLPDDRDTLIGLPHPICEGVNVLKNYVYISLGDVQMQREEQILKFPLSQKFETPANTTETLYKAMLPNMQQNIIALLKILLAAAPTSKTKTDTINIVTPMLPEELPVTILQSMKLNTDMNRHKEIVVKAVSAILLLLLKHFKLNHVYQFEFLSQYLVFANCIPLILKFFNQNINGYVGMKSEIPILDFPACVIGDQPELTSESLEIGDSRQCCWRNVFSCINLLRVLNKVTKWKHSRIMMLVVFKSAPILKRTLKVRHAMMQLYVLKLLKMQTKYLGRAWRKSNMKTMSAIYQKVRHRLNDDWAFGNDIDARPWDFQADECSLRSAVDKFNNRRYNGSSNNNNSNSSQSSDANNSQDYIHIEETLNAVLSAPCDLSSEFKRNYELWVRQELYVKPIDWDQVINMKLIN